MGYTLSDKIFIMESLLLSYQGYLLFLRTKRVPLKKEGNHDNFTKTIP
jgi:hypothetical protein